MATRATTLSVDIPLDVLEQLAAEARRDELTIAEWLLEAATMRLVSRQAVGDRARGGKRDLCRWCLRQRRIHARGYCRSCYYTQYRAEHQRPCAECWRWRPIQADGLCGACYQRRRRRQRAA